MSEDNSHYSIKRVEAQVPLGHEVLRFNAEISDQPVQIHDLLPLFQDITNRVISVAIQTVEANGERISCGSGCGACCSQLVPISRAEGYALLALVARLPDERQHRVRLRFEQNLARFNESGLNRDLERAFRENDRSLLRKVGLDYFNLNLPCPFLEDQSCSIHPERPISCREFLVVSDPGHCSKPTPETIRKVALPAQVSKIVYEMCYQHQEHQRGYLPMTLLYDQATQLRQEYEGRPASELVSELLARLVAAAGNAED
ncbi:MAG: YkgJ family cysteine cluster protein [Candidatus Thiodiazotropha sp.]